MNCSNCQNPIQEGEKFCGKCGNHFSNNTKRSFMEFLKPTKAKSFIFIVFTLSYLIFLASPFPGWSVSSYDFLLMPYFIIIKPFLHTLHIIINIAGVKELDILFLPVVYGYLFLSFVSWMFKKGKLKTFFVIALIYTIPIFLDSPLGGQISSFGNVLMMGLIEVL